ncbi:MAG: hypothetical protein RL367_1876, partial [Pseudomonadota bacterium]
DLQQRYLAIEAVRFPGRLTVEFDVPDTLRDCAVPGLILQPLVENGIKHGVSQTSQHVTLTITARADPDQLILTVSDNAPPKPNTSPASGIGLANIRHRLAARYGDAATLRTTPRAPNGFDAVISLPLERIND